jgi:hypothetical protein
MLLIVHSFGAEFVAAAPVLLVEEERGQFEISLHL